MESEGFCHFRLDIPGRALFSFLLLWTHTSTRVWYVYVYVGLQRNRWSGDVRCVESRAVEFEEVRGVSGMLWKVVYSGRLDGDTWWDWQKQGGRNGENDECTF